MQSEEGEKQEIMNATLQISLLVIILLYFIWMIKMLSSGSINLRYSLLWLAVGFIMLLLVVFPGAAEKIFHAIGIQELTNGIFAAALFGIVIVATSITSIVSLLNNKLKSLIQAVGLLEKRVRELEAEINQKDITDEKNN